jgi:hypothetical protein
MQAICYLITPHPPISSLYPPLLPPPYSQACVHQIKTKGNKSLYMTWIVALGHIRLNLGMCIAPTQPFRAALGAESRVWVTQQTGNYNERSRTATSRSQQQIRTKRWFTATAGIRTCDLRDVSAPLWPLGQVPPHNIESCTKFRKVIASRAAL